MHKDQPRKGVFKKCGDTILIPAITYFCDLMNRILLLAAIFVIAFGSCNDNKGTGSTREPRLLATNDIDQYTPPPAGAVIAADSMAITDDPLNHFTFSVRIKTNDYSDKGTYAIEAFFGPNKADGMFTMPRGGSHLKPILHRSKEQYTYIIGFEYQHNFYEYYRVAGSKGTIEIKNIKAYAFQ